MNKKNTSVIALVIAAVIVILIAVIMHPSKTEVVTPAQPVQQVGGVNPDSPFDYQSFGGVRSFARRTESLNQASTTVCAIQAPAATSTLVEGSGAKFTVSSTTASTVTAYKSADAFSATTVLFAANIAANAQGTAIATTTTDNFVFNPNQWLVIKMSGGTGTFSPTGTCQGVFMAI